MRKIRANNFEFNLIFLKMKYMQVSYFNVMIKEKCKKSSLWKHLFLNKMDHIKDI